MARTTVFLSLSLLLLTGFLGSLSAIKPSPLSLEVTLVQNNTQKPYTGCYAGGRVLSASLTNTSSDTIRFWSLSCSKSSIFILDKKGLELCKELCQKNGPVIVTLPPNKKYTLGLEVTSTDFAKNSGAFKVGLLYHEVNRDKEFVWPASPEGAEIIWSNSVPL